MNGVYFATGHGMVVTLIAAGIGRFLAARLEFLSPWMLILIGLINLWRLLRPVPPTRDARRLLIAQPLLLGMLLAAGFETSSQLSALVLAGRTNPWLLGAAFSGGMILVDGVDGFLAAATQRKAKAGFALARNASRALGIIVVVFSFCLGGAELAGLSLDRIALPVGLTLFAIVVAIRVWARSDDPVKPHHMLHSSEHAVNAE
jgi:high-affinity nickel-transport protein